LDPKDRSEQIDDVPAPQAPEVGPTAPAARDGFRVHHSLVRDHLTLGTTPRAVAGLPSVGGFRWSEILRLPTQTRTNEPEIQIVAEPRTGEGQGANDD
jgi:hypothetical protein